MSLAELLSADQIIPEMKATERWDAIVEVMDLLVARGQIKPEDREEILASLKQREETMSTGIGFGVAIPHARSSAVSQLTLVGGVSPEPVPFDSIDGEPVRLFFLIVGPESSAGQHVKVLSRIARLVKHENLREQLAKFLHDRHKRTQIA